MQYISKLDDKFPVEKDIQVSTTYRTNKSTETYKINIGKKPLERIFGFKMQLISDKDICQHIDLKSARVLNSDNSEITVITGSQRIHIL